MTPRLASNERGFHSVAGWLAITGRNKGSGHHQVDEKALWPLATSKQYATNDAETHV